MNLKLSIHQNEEVCVTISLGTQAATDSAVKAARKAFITW